MRTRLLAAAFISPLMALDASAQIATQTQSNGIFYGNEYVSDGRRNDTYETLITGRMEDGTVVFDQVHNWSFDEPIVRNALAAATSPRAYMGAGGPGILVWSDPRLIDSFE